jgi:hypothetical protein
MLGHANLSQTSIYLHAAGRGLQESMKRFDEARADRRAKSVVNEGPTEQQSVHHQKVEKDGKGLLH